MDSNQPPEAPEQQTQSMADEGLSREAWIHMVWEIHQGKQSVLGCHIFDMCQPGNRWDIEEGIINMLAEPDRTMCLRIYAGEFPITREMRDSMPPEMQTLWNEVRAIYDKKRPTTRPLRQFVQQAIIDKRWGAE